MSNLIRVLVGIQHACLWLASLVLGLLPLITFYDVMMRYLFHAPTIWASEVSLYLLQFLVFFTLGALVLDGSHVRVTFWIEGQTGPRRAWAEAVTTALILPYAGILVWYGGLYASNAFNRGMLSPTLLEIPLWLPYGLIPAGGLLLALGALTKIMMIARDPAAYMGLAHGQGEAA
ncbi:TRAP transporter small permease [Xanthobacter variabilis]|uniref:TRAP transporter small permease n=1 Tax=Xanthobacter variabilis TaxID=3119932 RepID=UPI00372C5D92